MLSGAERRAASNQKSFGSSSRSLDLKKLCRNHGEAIRMRGCQSKCCKHVARPQHALQSGHSRKDLSLTRMPPVPLARTFFDRSVHAVAPELIGATLLCNGVGGEIVEVEAYHHTDPAAHSYRGRTERNAVMFGPPGFAYVYRSYGIHWCLNFVCEAEGSASAVLIRALRPTTGSGAMRRRRRTTDERLLCSGPGRLCQALGIGIAHNGLALDAPPFLLLARAKPPELVAGVRIGITKAVEQPWRYGLAGSRFLSRPFRRSENPLPP
jgi:DNA-3-methyladenine glycosylase